MMAAVLIEMPAPVDVPPGLAATTFNRKRAPASVGLTTYVAGVEMGRCWVRCGSLSAAETSAQPVVVQRCQRKKYMVALLDQRPGKPVRVAPTEATPVIDGAPNNTGA